MKSVRVIVCSTFRDMHAERDHLVTVVSAELRERVKQLGLEVFDVEMRWGMRRPAATTAPYQVGAELCFYCVPLDRLRADRLQRQIPNTE